MLLMSMLVLERVFPSMSLRLFVVAGYLVIALFGEPQTNRVFGQEAKDPLPSARPIPKVQAIPLPHSRTSFQLDGRELTAAHYDPSDRRVFWYPVRSSLEPSLTRMGHPHDPQGHSHHNSVWIAHSDVDGVNFWGDRGKNLGHIQTNQIPPEAYSDSDQEASMQMINHWIDDYDSSVMLVETRRVTIRPIDGAKSWWMIVDMELTAPPGVTTTLKPSGFGLMAVRMAKSIGVRDGGGRILNSEGSINESAIFRKPAQWCDYSGRLSPTENGFAGITLMNHPSNPSHPTPFHVRDDGWMGACLNLEESISISESNKLRLRYGLWVHDGVPTESDCQANWKQWSELPLASLELKKP